MRKLYEFLKMHYNLSVAFFKKIRRPLFLFFLCVGLGAGGITGLRYWQVNLTLSRIFIPQPNTLQLNAPDLALQGLLTSVTGVITVDLRSGKQEAAVSNNLLFQGESLFADATGSALLTFPSLGQVIVTPDTKLVLVDTLPTEFLLNQLAGSVTYIASDSAHPISVKSQHALFQISSGSATITYESSRYVRLIVDEGEVMIGYQDKDQNTYKKIIEANQTARYDDILRQVKITSAPIP